MNARDSEPPRDPDDWFDEPQPLTPRRPRRPHVQADSDARTREHAAMPADHWLAPESLTRKGRRRGCRRSGIAASLQHSDSHLRSS